MPLLKRLACFDHSTCLLRPSTLATILLEIVVTTKHSEILS